LVFIHSSWLITPSLNQVINEDFSSVLALAVKQFSDLLSMTVDDKTQNSQSPATYPGGRRAAALNRQASYSTRIRSDPHNECSIKTKGWGLSVPGEGLEAPCPSPFPYSVHLFDYMICNILYGKLINVLP
jgi:hypothetical protein